MRDWTCAGKGQGSGRDGKKDESKGGLCAKSKDAFREPLLLTLLLNISGLSHKESLQDPQ